MCTFIHFPFIHEIARKCPKYLNIIFTFRKLKTSRTIVLTSDPLNWGSPLFLLMRTSSHCEDFYLMLKTNTDIFLLYSGYKGWCLQLFLSSQVFLIPKVTFDPKIHSQYLTMKKFKNAAKWFTPLVLWHKDLTYCKKWPKAPDGASKH